MPLMMLYQQGFFLHLQKLGKSLMSQRKVWRGLTNLSKNQKRQV